MFRSFSHIYIICQYGDILTGKFAELSETIYQLDWYKFPSEIQQILPTLLIGAQQPVFVEGFGNIRCTCEVFKKVILE